MMPACPCTVNDPIRALDYMGAHYRANQLANQGWRQRKCRDCGLYTVWVKQGDKDRTWTWADDALASIDALRVQRNENRDDSDHEAAIDALRGES